MWSQAIQVWASDRQANNAIYIVIWCGLFNDPLAPNKVSALLDAKGRAKFNFLFFF